MDELSAYGFFTVCLAFLLASIFASCCGMLRFRMPGETELTMASAILHSRKGK